jgi:N utilization substance protein A
VLLLDEEGNELILPKSEQIPQDYFKKGENIRAVVARVDLKNNSPGDHPFKDQSFIPGQIARD